MIALEKLLALLPPPLLEQLALEHKVDAKNQVRLTGSTVFVCLLNGLVNHSDLTQRLLEDIYQERFAPHTKSKADHSSFGKRLATIKPAYFEAIYAHLHQKLAPQATPGETQALRLRWADATLVTLSAKLLSFGIQSGSGKHTAATRSVESVLSLHEDGLPHLLHVCREQKEAADTERSRRQCSAGPDHEDPQPARRPVDI